MPPTMDAFLTADGLIALATLAALEIVLGVDNVVFIAILTGRLPVRQRESARRLGLTLALGIRIGLLFTISWMMGLTRPLLAVLGHAFTGRDLILIGGGLFLVGKATWEIYDKLEVEHVERAGAGRAQFVAVLAQILLLDIVFSLDSVITAVGMANRLEVMVAAMVIAMLVMLASMGAVAGFVERHPSVKILALSFLLLNDAVLVQYARFMQGAVRGDFGESLRYRRDALGLVLERLPATLLLAGTAMLLTLTVAVPLGVVSAVRRDRAVDHAGTVLTVLGQAIPGFWLGLMMIYVFAVQLRWLPTGGMGGLAHLVMPSIVLAAFYAARVARLTRSAVLDALGGDYVLTARA